jgi:hypothetical protein
MFLQTASLRSDNCSPSRGQLFAIVRNGCSASFGITVRDHRNTQAEKALLMILSLNTGTWLWMNAIMFQLEVLKLLLAKVKPDSSLAFQRQSSVKMDITQ